MSCCNKVTCPACGSKFDPTNEKFQVCHNCGQDFTPEPRGSGPVLDNLGQPNIIDYTNKQPMFHMTQLDKSQAGLILLNNEPERTSAGFDPRPGIALKDHGDNGSLGETVSIPSGLVDRKIRLKESFNEEDHPRVPAGSEQGGQFTSGAASKPTEMIDKFKQTTPTKDKYTPNPNVKQLLDDSGELYNIGPQKKDDVDVEHADYISGDPDSIKKYDKLRAFLVDTKSIRVVTYSPNTVGFELRTKPTRSQLKMIRDLENQGIEVSWDIFSDREHGSDAGYRNLVQHLSKVGWLSETVNLENTHKFLSEFPKGSTEENTECQICGLPLDDEMHTKPIIDENDSWSNKMRENPTGIKLQQANGPQIFENTGIHLIQATPQFDPATYGRSGDITPFQEAIRLKKMLKYHYHPNPEGEDCKICKPLDGTMWDNDDKRRPILPSEKFGEGVLNTHPNCLCTWEEISEISEAPDDAVLRPTKGDKPIGKKIQLVADERARITNKYLRRLAFDPVEGESSWNLKKPLQEAQVPGFLKENFSWVTDDALKELYKPQQGKFILVIASTPGVTDHRREGEKLRRMYTPNLIRKMTYTGIGKLLDINHELPKKDPGSGVIFDSEFNETTQEMEMIIYETDEEILQGIRDGKITAVSTNAGQPRKMDIKCVSNECFSVPDGVVLGEGSNVGLTYVVTDPKGMLYNGKWIPPTIPGNPKTRIHILE